MQDELVSIMGGFSINSIAIDEKENRIDIYLNKKNDIVQIIDLLQSKDFYVKEALHFIVSSNFDEPKANTAYGGDTINATEFLSISSGTMCVNAYDNDTGKYGILTNEHVALNNTMYHNGGVLTGSKIGKATKAQFGGTIDAAFVPFEDQSKWDVTSHSRSGSNIYTNIWTHIWKYHWKD